MKLYDIFYNDGTLDHNSPLPDTPPPGTHYAVCVNWGREKYIPVKGQWRSTTERPKTFYEQHGTGHSRRGKYSVNFHDGVSTHKDGSPFYDMRLFSNKKDLAKFISKLIATGYRRE